MDWKRIAYSSICLLLVVVLLFHMSPIKAEAVALEASLVIGLVGSLILATAGVVFVPDSVNQIQAIGQSFKTYMYQWGTSAEKLDEVEEWFSGLSLYDPSSGDEDDDDWVSPTNRKVNLARGILAGISAWCASIILGNIQVEEESDPAPAGYMYYNGIKLPALPAYDAAAYPYLCIWRNTDGNYTLCVAPFRVYVQSDGDLQAETSGKYRPHNITDADVWYSSVTVSRSPSGAAVKSAGEYTLIWSNYDIMKDGEVFMSGTEPASSYTTVVEPETYVGDIPQQIQDGELEPGGIELPDINYDPLIQPGVSLQDSTIGTLHKLSTGELSYENFLQQIKVDGDSLDPEPSPDPDVQSETLANTQVGTFLNNLLNPIKTALQNLGNTILNGIRDIFVPKEDFLTSKVDALAAEFAFAGSIVQTVKTLVNGLSGVSTEPPVIYIDLGSQEGFYDMGGKVPFIDLRWYEQYKPTVDVLIGAFLWICFLWRLLIHLPGIIGGASGLFMLSPLPSTQTTPDTPINTEDSIGGYHAYVSRSAFRKAQGLPDDGLGGGYSAYIPRSFFRRRNGNSDD